MDLTIRPATTFRAAALALLLAACGGDGSSGPVATTIVIAPTTPSIRVGESTTLVATPVDAQGNVVAVAGQLTWASSAAAIATVDNAGKVTGVSAGGADITASVSGLSGTTRVTVTQLPVARVDIQPTSVSFTRAQTQQLAASMFASDNTALTGRVVTWTTSNATVVSLSATTGTTVTLTAVAPGSATITATSEGITRDVAVTVQPDPVIAFTPPTASLGATAGGANPAPLTITVSNSGGGTLGGLAVGAVTYAGGQPTGWLTAAFEGATSAPAPLTLRGTTGTLVAGTYTASVPVTSTSPGATSRTLAVTFNVGSALVLGASPTSVSFTAPPVSGNPANQTVSIFSVNGTAIPGLALGAVEYAAGQPTGWLTPSISGATTPATLTLAVAVGTLASGTYTANVPVAAATASNSPLKVPVTLIVPAPTIALSATSRAFVATQGIGATAGQTIQVTNGGRGTLSGLQVGVSYGAGATNWLSASLSGGTAPATLTLTPTANTIARGTYTATVQISAAGISNSPQTVSVTYQLVYTFDTHIAGTLASTAAGSGCSNSSCHRIGGQVPVLAAGSGDVYARLLSGYVTANNTAASLLYQRVAGSPSPMPPAPTGVVPAIRDAIRDWILDGARRN